MLPSEILIWQPEFTDKTLSRKPGAVHLYLQNPPRHARHTGETHALNLNQPSQLCRLLKKLAHSVR
ncbi:hypothetical protein BUX51_22310 [Salmonella enterica subsp. enterica serovar Newport]|nr:hypothetical protein [Salmonella enterica subsp. enterica serovar Newport]